jgi:D-alanyl-D-alanine dipeptidase
MALLMGGTGLAAETRPADKSLPEGFVWLDEVAPTVLQEVRYAGEDNFVGAPITGYTRARIVLTRPAAEALARIQTALRKEGFGLKVFDGYRPQRAVLHFVRWAKDPQRQETKVRYYPDVPKEELFARGYIALQSGHSRGSSVDLTLVRRAEDGTWHEVDMGTPFDFFGPESWPDSEAVDPAQRGNRLRLQEAMLAGGFKPYPQEWWHFTLAGEPYPETYFDFPIE